jgi:hypothetical protein
VGVAPEVAVEVVVAVGPLLLRPQAAKVIVPPTIQTVNARKIARDKAGPPIA